MAINSLKILSYVGAVLKTILHFHYNRFNPAVLEKSQNMLFTTRNNGLYIQDHLYTKMFMVAKLPKIAISPHRPKAECGTSLE